MNGSGKDLNDEFQQTMKRRKNGGESKAKGSHRTLEMPFMLELEGELFSVNYTDEGKGKSDE